ncbi:MAG: alpha-amylase family glycosyl hydrolase [Tissierellia bacterium]|nr:alpha-amylase family glycosyl hydrolase [Tissierellia bacterium]
MSTKVYLSGKEIQAYEFLGCHKKSNNDYIFRVFAPNASEVYLVGDFNDWQKEKMRSYSSSLFSLSNKKAKPNDNYLYIVKTNDGEFKKLDPYSRLLNIDYELSSVVYDDSYKFKSKTKIKKNNNMNILQVYLGNICKDKNGNYKSIRDVSNNFISYVKQNNYTHIQLLPINEYIDYKSLGYKAISFFAISSRYGTSDDFKYFIDNCHKNKIGVIIDLNLSEFDDHYRGLINFDGDNLYNYPYDDIKYNYYGAVNLDISKNSTKSFVKSIINFYLEEFRVDGIRFNAIENIIYWQGDINRGINQKWFDLIKELINIISSKNAISITDFNYNDNVIYDIGFDFINLKDTRAITKIFQENPFLRDEQRNTLEEFINNSKDFTIQGFDYILNEIEECSLPMKMWGDFDKKFRQLKTYLTLLYMINGSKIMFLGNEISSFKTFSPFESFDNSALENKNNKEFNKFYKDLSKIYIEMTSKNLKSKIKLMDSEGYSVYIFKKIIKDKTYLIVLNLTDINYNIDIDMNLEEIINSDSIEYGGFGNINGKINKGEKIKISQFSSAIFKEIG